MLYSFIEFNLNAIYRRSFENSRNLGLLFVVDYCTNVGMEQICPRGKHDCLRNRLLVPRLEQPFIHYCLFYLCLLGTSFDDYLLLLFHFVGKNVFINSLQNFSNLYKL